MKTTIKNTETGLWIGIRQEPNTTCFKNTELCECKGFGDSKKKKAIINLNPAQYGRVMNLLMKKANAGNPTMVKIESAFA